MLEDISIYKDVRKNAKCPCGSGEIFKKCCMNEYRDANKHKSKAILSSYSPLKPLNDEDKEFFVNFYEKLFIFSHQDRNNSDIIFAGDADDSMLDFMSREREYFYENIDEIIASYIEKKNPTTPQLELLKNIQEAKYSEYILMSHSENSAVLMDFEQNFYNVQGLESSFNKIFKHTNKYIGIETAVIAYQNCYIADGIYGVFELDSKSFKELDQIPYTQPQINYSKYGDITILPLLIHFSLFCDAENFQEMEDIVLTKIPAAFAKGLLSLFDEIYSQSKNIVPAFFRSTDLAHELNDEEGDHKFSIMIGGTPVTNFEKGNRDEVIPYEIMANYYQQKSLKDSASKSVYENIQKSKSSFSGSFTDLSSFYTMIGMVNIFQDDVDDFLEFLERFNKPNHREELMVGVDNLFDELSREFGFKMSAIFLGVGIELDSIHSEIDEYRDVMIKLDGASMKEVRKYSVTKGK